MMSLILELLIPTNERQEIGVFPELVTLLEEESATLTDNKDNNSQRAVDLACVASISVQQQLISITPKQTFEVFCSTS